MIAASPALLAREQRALARTRRRVLTTEEPTRLADEVRRVGQRAFALLEHGLGDYATKPTAQRTR